MIRFRNDGCDRTRIRLDAVRDAVAMVDLYLAEINDLHGIRTRITSTLAEVSSSGGDLDDRRQAATAALVDAEAGLECAVRTLAAQRDELSAAIDDVRGTKQREILRRRYLLRQRFGQIARDMDMVERQVLRVHNRAVAALDVIMFGNKEESPD